MRTVFSASILAALVGLISACAKPTYITSGSTLPQNEKASSDGCSARFQPSNACLTIRWEKFPTEEEFGSFIMTVSRRDSWRETTLDLEKAANGVIQPLSITPYMPSMGHGVDRPIVIEKLGPGTYRASKVFFTMKQDWELRFGIGDNSATYAFFIE